MRSFFCSLVISMGLALTALSAPNYFYDAPIESPFIEGKPVVNGATYDDIRQTGAPTCSFLAALSAAAHSGIDLEQNIKHLGGRDYSVRLFVNDRWVEVKVTFDGWTRYDPAPAQAGEFWVSLYQRAYLSAFNVDCSDTDWRKWAVVKDDGTKTDQDKDSQPWLWCSTALTAITGLQTEKWNVDQDDLMATSKRIRDAIAEKRCVVIATKGRSDEELVEDKVCLLERHAYTVTAASEKWIEVRNPHGFDIPTSLLRYTKWKNGRVLYAFKEGYSDGKDDNPNDGIVRVPLAHTKFFVQAYVSKGLKELPPPKPIAEGDEG